MALTTFSDLVAEAVKRIKRDALAAGMPADVKRLASGGTGATAYADAVRVFSFLVSKLADGIDALHMDAGPASQPNCFRRSARVAPCGSHSDVRRFL